MWRQTSLRAGQNARKAAQQSAGCCPSAASFPGSSSSSSIEARCKTRRLVLHTKRPAGLGKQPCPVKLLVKRCLRLGLHLASFSQVDAIELREAGDIPELLRELGIKYDPDRLAKVLQNRPGKVRARAVQITASVGAFVARLLKVSVLPVSNRLTACCHVR